MTLNLAAVVVVAVKKQLLPIGIESAEKKFFTEQACIGVTFLHEKGHFISTTPNGCCSEGLYTLASGDAPRKV